MWGYWLSIASWGHLVLRLSLIGVMRAVLPRHLLDRTGCLIEDRRNRLGHVPGVADQQVLPVRLTLGS